ncbi:Pimeloyl-ACP methyl ester carboxylesterase [Glycomyces sambucus]|uniref:Pimeloyl-ACP methyl ester carboxylesterase n=1 Tax=Glycomyces sambucus TaxID=380244 RepID=A0A1G9IBX6_9ACTN|nr:alpha/beta hydrolase [Glycomyces sambucus]SDL22740.1 Pimeloyl-ACP methyl ester carboxylesterase [Glycomyces sambucus]
MRSLYKSDAGRRIIQHWCRARLGEWSVPHRTDRVPVDGSSAHLTFIGDGPARVVFVPGTNFNAATCTGVAEALGARWATMVVDMPGQPGLSTGERPRRPLAPRPYAQSWYGETLSKILKLTAVRDAVVVGNSLGAAIALSCDSPCIAARVLSSPGGIVPLRTDPLLMRRSLAWLASPSPERTRALLDLFCAPGSAPAPTTVEWMALVARYCRTTLAPAPLRSADLQRWRGTPLVAAVGEHDRFLPADRLAPAVESAFGRELRILPGVGHLAVEERPGDVVALVQEALGLVGA